MFASPEHTLPRGIVTFVFTDIEGSTPITQQMEASVGIGRYESGPRDEQRQRLWENLAKNNRGFEVQRVGDGHMYVFQRVADALAAVIEFQQSLHSQPIFCEVAGQRRDMKVRIGVHTARVEREPMFINDFLVEYPGTDTNFAARIGNLGVGGQIIVSDETQRRWPHLNAGSQYYEWPNRLLKSFDDEPHEVYEVLYFDGQSPREPGIRFFPDFYKGEHNRYIARDTEEKKIFAEFSNKRPDGTLKRNDGTTSRLVTIKAEGGMGKTRLAIACAVKMIGLFEGNAHFVDVTFVSSSKEAVAEAIGKAMVPPLESATPDSVSETLKARGDERTLIILDNYESVKCREVAEFLAQLVAETRGVYLLVTGRTSVGLSDGEQIVSLEEGMGEAEARELFLARASLKNYVLTSPDEPHLARILRLASVEPNARTVQAIPLAIELAAAWSGDDEQGICTLKEIADGLQETPLGEFSGLPDDETVRINSTTTRRRHDSLTRSLNWSFEMLSKKEGGVATQKVFAACGLFVDTFERNCVAQISGEKLVSQALRDLQNVSLIRRATQDGTTRYFLHRFTRAYALSRLADLPDAHELQQRFVAHYIALVQANCATQMHMNRAECRAVLDKEWRNVMAAIEVAANANIHKAVLSLKAIDIFLNLRSLWAECEKVEEKGMVAARELGDRHGEGQTLNNLGVVYESQGKWDEAIDMYEQAVAIFRGLGDRHGEGQTLNNLGIVYRSQGKWDEAIGMYEQSLLIKRGLGDRHGEAQTLGNLGNVYRSQGKWDEAIGMYEQAVAIFRGLGDRHGEAQTLNNLGVVYESQGKWDEAIGMYEQSLLIKRGLGDRHGEGATLGNLGIVYRSQGKWDEAIDMYEQAVAIFRGLGDRHGEGQTLNNLGIVYRSQGKWDEAIGMYEQSLLIKRGLGDRHGEAQTLGNLALLWVTHGDLVQALAFIREAVAVLEQTQDNVGLNKARALLQEIEAALSKLRSESDNDN